VFRFIIRTFEVVDPPLKKKKRLTVHSEGYAKGIEALMK
jgi:hypothetical protein